MNKARFFCISIIVSIILSLSKADFPPVPSGLPDLVCSSYDEQQHFCQAPAQITNGFIWNQSDSTINFENITADIRDGQYCQIYIIADVIIFNHVNLSGCEIYFNSSNLTIQETTISTSNTQVFGPGYSTGATNTSIGNSYAGYGGSCSSYLIIDQTYGDFNTIYIDSDNSSSLGSGGQYSKGGGRIMLLTTVLGLKNSSIIADGGPGSLDECSSQQTNENGGTGGYIYLQHQYIFPLDDDGSIVSASGGWSCQKNQFGGSGGRIIIDGPWNNRQAIVLGGQTNQSACNAGGSGTVYYPAQNLLVLSNDISEPTPATPTVIMGNTTANVTILISNGFVVPKNASFDNEFVALFSFEGLTIQSSGRLGCPIFLNTTNSLNISTQSVSLSGNAQISCTGNVYLNADTLSIQNQSLVTAGSTNTGSMIEVQTNNLYIQNSSILFSTAAGSTLIILTKMAELVDGASLNAAFLVFKAQNLVLNGQITITNQTCFGITLHPRSKLINPLDFGLQLSAIQNYYDPTGTLEDFVSKFLINDYTGFLLAEQNLTLVNAQIAGSRIGLFAQYFSIDQNSNVTSDGLGCPSDAGPGHGTAFNGTSNCASTGGGHGGLGGIGGSIFTNLSQCISQTMFLQSLYGSTDNPLYEGSGGALYNNEKGGSGGGAIFIGAQNTLRIDGKISANGLSPQNCGNPCGAGSGAGGSLQLFMNSLVGSGNVTAQGGDTCSTCYGGEGGGGRIRLNYLNALQANQIINDDEQHPTISAAKGLRLNTIKTPDGLYSSFYYGSDGSISSTPCLPGYFGLFCDICPAYYEKSDFSNSECSACQILQGSYLDNTTGQNSYICNYTCNFKYMDSQVMVCADDLFSYAFHTGAIYIFVIFGVVIFIAVLIASSIWMAQWKNKKKEKKLKMMSLNLSLSNHQDEGHYFAHHHVERIHLLGDNLPENRWFINMDLVKPKNIDLIREQIDSLRKDVNRITIWKKLWILILKILIIFNHALYLFLLRKFKNKILKKVQALMDKTNEDLTNFCRLKMIPRFYLLMTVSSDYSSGYFDVFQDGCDHSAENTAQPISIMLSGNGTFFSPYCIDTADALLRHFIKYWIDDHSRGMNKVDSLLFTDHIAEFVHDFNKTAKFIDYYSSVKELKFSLQQLINYVKAMGEQFTRNFDVYFYLYAMQIPKFTVEETDSTQPFLQSPFQATILTNQDVEILEEFVEKIRKVKLQENSDIKFCLLIHSNKSPSALKMTTQIKDRRISMGDDLPEEKEAISLSEIPSSADVQDLKNEFFSKLDACINTEEYSIPKDMVKNYKNKKRNLRRDRFYQEPKKYFTRIKKFFRFFFMMKKYRRTRVAIYGACSLMIILDLLALWFRFVVFATYYKTFGIIATIFAPFPLAQIGAPFAGIIAIITSSFRALQYFMVFNFLSVLGKIADIIIASPNYDGPYIAVVAVSLVASIIIQFLCPYLADVQSKY